MRPIGISVPVDPNPTLRRCTGCGITLVVFGILTFAATVYLCATTGDVGKYWSGIINIILYTLTGSIAIHVRKHPSRGLAIFTTVMAILTTIWAFIQGIILLMAITGMMGLSIDDLARAAGISHAQAETAKTVAMVQLCVALAIAIIVGICSIVITGSVNRTIYMKEQDRVMFIDQEAPPAYDAAMPRHVDFKNEL